MLPSHRGEGAWGGTQASASQAFLCSLIGLQPRPVCRQPHTCLPFPCPRFRFVTSPALDKIGNIQGGMAVDRSPALQVENEKFFGFSYRSLEQVYSRSLVFTYTYVIFPPIFLWSSTSRSKVVPHLTCFNWDSFLAGFRRECLWYRAACWSCQHMSRVSHRGSQQSRCALSRHRVGHFL